MQKKAQAIILRRVAYGDADWIVTFFTRHKGRMSGMARSARSSKRRFAGALEPGILVDIRYSERRGADLVRISEAVALRSVHGAMKSLERINGMTLALELALNFLQEHQPAPDKFDMLNAFLEGLSRNDPTIWDILAYEYRWLSHCGFRPNLEHCSHCEDTPADGKRWMFDFDQRGLICDSCAKLGGARYVLPNTVVGTLTNLSDGVIGECERKAHAGERILRKYIDHVLGRRLKSPAISL